MKVLWVSFETAQPVSGKERSESRRGMATPKAELNLIARPLKRAREDYE
jgi:hypothetical protein